MNKCRFGYPKPPSDKTIIAMPFPDDMDKEEQREKLQLYRGIMTKVKMELESPNLDENQDLDNFLEKLNIKKKLYQEALTVSESGKTANLKRTLKD